MVSEYGPVGKKPKQTSKSQHPPNPRRNKACLKCKRYQGSRHFWETFSAARMLQLTNPWQMPTEDSTSLFIQSFSHQIEQNRWPASDQARWAHNVTPSSSGDLILVVLKRTIDPKTDGFLHSRKPLAWNTYGGEQIAARAPHNTEMKTLTKRQLWNMVDSVNHPLWQHSP